MKKITWAHHYMLPFLCSIFTLMIHKGTLAQSPTSKAIQKEAIQELEFSSDKSIVSKRFACVHHQMGSIKADVEAQGTAFPDVASYCVAVLKEAGRRGTLPQLYGLIEPLGKMEPWGKIFDAANRNQSHYVTAGGRRKRITCPLAFDAGYAGGYNQPDKRFRYHHLPEVRIQKMMIACFDPAIEDKSLSIAGRPASSAHIGFIAGYRRGQRDANKKR